MIIVWESSGWRDCGRRKRGCIIVHGSGFHSGDQSDDMLSEDNGHFWSNPGEVTSSG